MARRQAAQLSMEIPDDDPVPSARVSGEETPKPRRVRAKANEDAPVDWRVRARRVFLWTCLGAAVLGIVIAGYQIDQFLASDGRFLLPGSPANHSNPNLTIDGVNYVSRDDVQRVFARDFGRSVYLLPLADRRRQLLTIDWVRDAAVQRRWPNKVAVRVTERKPIAFVVLPDSTGQFPGSEIALVDIDGVILRPPAKARFSLPVLVGVTRKDELEARRTRVRVADEMIREVQGLASQISEIDVNDPEDLVVTEVIQGRALRLHLGHQNYLSRLSNFLNLYTDISKRLPNARSFDLRLDGNITAQDGGPDGR